MARKRNIKVAKKGTIAQALRSLTGFTIQMFIVITVVMTVFLGIIFVNVYNFYNVEFVTETYQLEIRKDVQTINKRLLLAVASNDSKVTAEQREDLQERFPKIEKSFCSDFQELK